MSELFDVMEMAVPGFPCAWSPCKQYRYTLWRNWGRTSAPRYLQIIGLNPSTADETKDDPTIRRCVGFAKAWGYDALCMTNLFAFRATDPDVMKAAADPVGEENDEWLRRIADGAGLVLAAWGVHGSHLNRSRRAVNLLGQSRLTALGFTKHGAPRHPLYMPKSAVPVRLKVAA